MKKYFRSVLAVFGLMAVSAVSAFSLPSQVQDVQVKQIGTESVRINWEEAESIEDIIIGYRVYFGTMSVQEAGATYDDEISVFGDIETTVENLLPGTTYYFAVTALDSGENESENYSVEVEFLLPAIEEEVLPEPEEEEELEITPPEEEELPLPVIECEELSIKLTNCEEYECDFTHTDTGETFIRTISGVVDDTCRYMETMPDDVRMECRYSSEMQSIMGEAYQDLMAESTEDLLYYSLTDGTCVMLEPGEVFPEEEVLPEPEEELEPFGPETPEEFKPVAPDVTAPMEALNLTADVDLISSNSMVILNWEKSLDFDNDVADQLIYVKEGIGNWDSGYSVGKGVDSVELDVTIGKNYEYKVVTVDDSGNRAESSVYLFSTKLAESGPAGMFGIVIAIFLIGMFALYSSRRRA